MQSLSHCLARPVTTKVRSCINEEVWADVHARPDQQVPGRRRARISKLKTVAGTLLDLQNDITDPITQVPSLEHLGGHAIGLYYRSHCS